MMRRRSIGVPMRTRSASERAIVSRSSSLCRSAVPHGREELGHVRPLLEGVLDRPDRERPGIDERRGAVRLRGEDAGAVAHLAVRERRPVLDRRGRACRDLRGVALDVERRGGERRLARSGCGSGSSRATASTPSCVALSHLVDDADVGHAQVRLARVVAELVPGAMRVDDDDVQVGLDRTAGRCCRHPRGSRRPRARPRRGWRRSRPRRRRSLPSLRCGSYSSRSSIVQSAASRSS